MNIREFLKPSIIKIVITLLLPIPVYFVMTGTIASVLDFYWYLFTPTINVYADVMYRMFNPWILAWIPFYLAACMIETLYKHGFGTR